MATYIVALTGASGAPYAVRLIGELLKRGDDVEAIISPNGFLILKEELGLDLSGKDPEAGLNGFVGRVFKKGNMGLKGMGLPRQAVSRGRVRVYKSQDITSRLASGSFITGIKAMVICPCSMGTLGRVAAGVSISLIERAADCALKEKRPLVLVPRETPLNAIHLENMLKLSRAGAIILPAMPAFYHGPKTVDDIVCFMAGKILDVLGIENDLYKRWDKDARL